MSYNYAVLDNYDTVIKRINAACLKAGRDPEEIKILAVTKSARTQDILTLLSNRDIFAAGESRLQDALEKWGRPPLNAFAAKKFFIGQLQSNKIRKIAENFDIIASLCDGGHAARIDAAAAELGKKAQCLAQLKLTDRQTQSGLPLSEAEGFIRSIRADFKNINLLGLMAIAPETTEAAVLRPLFKEVKKFFDLNFGSGAYLSLGMSGDFEIAVEEGSNLPRIGGAIFN
ncbi:MAG: YggS family pyridoxal phosphate-dependent enzyme [Elusimicrobiota bacterium]|jgi:pyridoxal phosphate enzyme (YggS family)|nr:YggS family pyridoxal phosphate-dependent enzyme [Elusimicrobiota bacterium]